MTNRHRIALALIICAAILAGPAIGFMIYGADGIAIALALIAMSFLALLIGNALFR